jgi:hypothetical protein
VPPASQRKAKMVKGRFRIVTLRDGRSVAVTSVLLAVMGCSTPPPSPPRGAVTVSLALPEALTDSACLRVTAAGAASLDVAVTGATESVQVTVNGVPSGSTTFTGAVFPSPCAAPVAAPAPSWVSDPVAATVDPARPAVVQLAMRKTATSAKVSLLDDTAEYPD